MLVANSFDTRTCMIPVVLHIQDIWKSRIIITALCEQLDIKAHMHLMLTRTLEMKITE